MRFVGFEGETVLLHTKISKAVKAQIAQISKATGIHENVVLNTAVQDGLASQGYTLAAPKRVAKGGFVAKKTKKTKKAKPMKKGC